MALTREEANRVLVNYDTAIIPDKKERYRKEFLHLISIALNINEASHQLSFVDIRKEVAGLIQVKLDALVDSHIHRALERYRDFMEQVELEDAQKNK